VTIGSLTVRKSKGPALDLQVESTTALASLSVAEVGTPAIRTTAQAASGIVAVSGEGAQVHIASGHFVGEAKLAAIGVPWLFTSEIQIDGEEARPTTLSVAAGAQLRFGQEGALRVGLYQTGKLVLAGEAAKPISLAAQGEAKPGAWRGVWIDNGGTLELRHASIADAGYDEGAAIVLDRNAKATISKLALANSTVGVRAFNSESTLTLTDSSFTDVARALELHPQVYGGVGSGNAYTGETRIALVAGQIERDTTWTAQAALVELTGNLDVSKGKLSIPGGKYQVDDAVLIGVGLYENATLELKGSVEQPVEIAGTRDEPQLWGPLTFNSHAIASLLEHVVLRSVAAPAGVVVSDGASVKVDDLRCDGCAATLQWSCAAKLERANVSAGANTAQAELAPSDCE